MDFIAEKNRKDAERFMAGELKSVTLTNDNPKGVSEGPVYFDPEMLRTIDETMHLGKFN